MLEVLGNNITLTKGDSASFNLSIFYPDMKTPYELKDGDSTRFYVSKKDSFTNKIKVYINKLLKGNTLKLDSIDTAYLPSGMYQYEIQLVTKEGDIETIVGPRVINLVETATINNLMAPLNGNSLNYFEPCQAQLVGILSMEVTSTSSLDDLVDVEVEEERYGDILKFENDKWVNSSIQEVIEDTPIILDGGELE